MLRRYLDSLTRLRAVAVDVAAAARALQAILLRLLHHRWERRGILHPNTNEAESAALSSTVARKFAVFAGPYSSSRLWPSQQPLPAPHTPN